MKNLLLMVTCLLLLGCTQHAIIADVAFIVPASLADTPTEIADIPLEECDVYGLGQQVSKSKPLTKPTTTYVLICQEGS